MLEQVWRQAHDYCMHLPAGCWSPTAQRQFADHFREHYLRAFKHFREEMYGEKPGLLMIGVETAIKTLELMNTQVAAMEARQPTDWLNGNAYDGDEDYFYRHVRNMEEQLSAISTSLTASMQRTPVPCFAPVDVALRTKSNECYEMYIQVFQKLSMLPGSHMEAPAPRPELSGSPGPYPFQPAQMPHSGPSRPWWVLFRRQSWLPRFRMRASQPQAPTPPTQEPVVQPLAQTPQLDTGFGGDGPWW